VTEVVDSPHRATPAAPALYPPLLVRARASATVRIVLATAALFLISPLIARGSIGSTGLLAMLPFAALLAVAAIGQTLVVQQGGLDLSVPGVISLSAMLTCRLGQGSGPHLLFAVGCSVLLCAALGGLSGVLVRYVRITPIVATIGVNALAVGGVQFLSGGYAAQAPRSLAALSTARWLGVPALVWIAAAIVLVLRFVIKSTLWGRRFEAVGANVRAARSAAIRPTFFIIAGYLGSAVLAALTGSLVAGFLKAPPLSVGDTYLLPTVAAVVLGGTSLAGGKGSVVATACGALFLSQLNQLVLTKGGTAAVQNIVSAAIIAVGVVLQLHLTTRRRSGGGSEKGTPHG
jgi:ribose transport system permease protein